MTFGRISCLVALVIAAWPSVGRARNIPVTPKGLTIADWDQIRAEYERHRHAAFPDRDGYHARSFEQHWLAHFDTRGFIVEPDGEDWCWGLELEGAGAQAQPSASVNRISYRRTGDIEEWFLNDTRGLEHGFTLRAPHRLVLAVRGGLLPRFSGTAIEFADDAGVARVRYSGLAARDATGKSIATHFTIAQDSIEIVIDSSDITYPLTIDPVAQQAYLKASNADASDIFGYSVAVSGSTVVVGAPDESSDATGVNGDQSNNSASRSGAAYVFVGNNSGNWTQLAYLKASNTRAAADFGASIAISGTTIAVGSPFESSDATGVNGNQADTSAPNAGAVYTFTLGGGTVAPQAYLKASNTSAGAQFGWSVGVDGNTLIAGAQAESSDIGGVNGVETQSDTGAFQSGAAYVFVENSGVWTQQAYLKASEIRTYAEFGFSVAVSGDTLAVGAPGETSDTTGVNGNQNDTSAFNAGAAYVFVRSNGLWSQQAYLKASNTRAGANFAYSVSISEDTVVAGSPFETSGATGVNGNQSDTSLSDAGSAYLFTRTGGVWTQQAYLKASNTAANLLFGFSVAASGDAVIIGGYGDASGATGVNGNQTDTSAPFSGAAYLFVRTGSTWSQQEYLKASNTAKSDYFGQAVAMGDSTVVIGAYPETGTGPAGSGAAYVFAPGTCATGAVFAPFSTYTPSGTFTAGMPLTIFATGSVTISDGGPIESNGYYTTDASGNILTAPSPGTDAYTYFSGFLPSGAPTVGGQKIYNNFPFGALIGVWAAPGTTGTPVGMPFLIGTQYSTTVPNVANGAAELFLIVNSQYYTNNEGAFVLNLTNGTCLLQPNVSLSHVGNFIQGQNGANYSIVVSNPNGSGPTLGTVSVTESVPTGMTLVSMSGNGWNCTPPTCERFDALPGGSSYPEIVASVNVSASAASPLINSVLVSGGGGPVSSSTDQTTILTPYADTAPGDFDFDAVNLMREYAITAGCETTDYCPTENVTRAQMAIFIVRAIEGGDNFTYSASPYFTDVQTGDFGFQWIQKMKELGITAGCTATTYCPNDPVTRAEMAIFIIRARLGVNLAGATPSFTYSATPWFSDVPTGAFGFAWIQRMKDEGITAGCTATTYCPNDPVTRGEMAIFVMRGAFNQLLPAGAAVISQVSPAAVTHGTSATMAVYGTNTNFVQGTTTISPIPGLTLGTVTVSSPTSLTVAVTAAADAVPGPYSLLAITGSEQAVIPNGLLVQ